MAVGAIASQSPTPIYTPSGGIKAQESSGATSDRVSDLSDGQKGVKEQMLTLKADNDLFGALKTLERSVIALGAIATEAQAGSLEGSEALQSIQERMLSTQYKGMNLFSHFPLEDGSTIDMSSRVKIDSVGAIGEFKGALEVLGKEVATNLQSVKDRILGGTQVMGQQAQASYEKSGMDRIDPASIVANTDVDYLKSQFKRLMG